MMTFATMGRATMLRASEPGGDALFQMVHVTGAALGLDLGASPAEDAAAVRVDALGVQGSSFRRVPAGEALIFLPGHVPLEALPSPAINPADEWALIAPDVALMMALQAEGASFLELRAGDDLDAEGIADPGLGFQFEPRLFAYSAGSTLEIVLARHGAEPRGLPRLSHAAPELDPKAARTLADFPGVTWTAHALGRGDAA